jgi:hypothetical protein
VEPDQLDQRVDLRLGAAQADLAPLRPQTTREHREVDHQRRIGERELAQVDDHISFGLDRTRQRPPPAALRASILVTSAPQRRGLVIEIDDPRNL